MAAKAQEPSTDSPAALDAAAAMSAAITDVQRSRANLSADKLLHLRPLPEVAIMAAINKSSAQSNKTASGRSRY
jgi:hypothetical protein